MRHDVSVGLDGYHMAAMPRLSKAASCDFYKRLGNGNLLSLSSGKLFSRHLREILTRKAH